MHSSTMSIEIKVPDLGDGVDSGDILDVLVGEGDFIDKDQGIVELETDKATVEVPSPQAGKVTQIHVEVGQSVAVGAVLISLEAVAPSEQPPKAEAAPAAVAAAPAEAPEESQPQPTQSTPEPAEPPSSPTPEPAAAPTVQPETLAAKSTLGIAEKLASTGKLAAGPAVRRFAREVGVDLHRITGTGSGGRITREDVLEAVRQSSQAAAAAPVETVKKGPGEASTDAWGPIRVERMPKIRRTIAAQMHKSWATCPRVTNFDDADVTELERIRQSSKADYVAQGIKLTSMSFLIKSVAMALRSHPLLNASIDMENGQIIYKDYINIGIAVDTERGLVVPPLRGADQMTIPDIARGLTQIAENARNNTFAIEDLRGGTFSISNLGAIGGTYSTPIINVPEVAILLVGRSRKMPVVVDNDQIAARLMMPLSLSYDHRLVDGGAAARFLNEVIGYLQTPSRLLLAP